jgi:hypothetical protein
MRGGYFFRVLLVKPMRSSRLLTFGGSALFGLASALASTPAQAAMVVCTPQFLASVNRGDPISADFTGPTPPCPASTVTASLNTTGSQSTAGNSGAVFLNDKIEGPGTNDFTRTSITSVSIGSDPSTNQPITLSFTQPVNNPYLFFSWLDSNSSFTFTRPIILAQANNASASGLTVTLSGSNLQDDGFVVQLPGTHSAINFTYNNTSASFNSVAFTVGVPVPGPLPLMGVAIGFGFTRKLRRRIRS